MRTRLHSSSGPAETFGVSSCSPILSSCAPERERWDPLTTAPEVIAGTFTMHYKPLRLLSSDYYFSLFCGSFSAVSKPNFASKYSFCSIFQDLHNEHAFAPPTAQNLRTFAQFCKFLMTFPDFLKILLKFDEIVLFFGENFTEFRRNSRKSQLTNGNSDFFFSFFRGEDFFQNIRKIVLEF